MKSSINQLGHVSYSHLVASEDQFDIPETGFWSMRIKLIMMPNCICSLPKSDPNDPSIEDIHTMICFFQLAVGDIGYQKTVVITFLQNKHDLSSSSSTQSEYSLLPIVIHRK